MPFREARRLLGDDPLRLAHVLLAADEPAAERVDVVKRAVLELADRRIEVARHGSFSAAAESLGYTQPAISRQLRLLREAGLGERMDREGHSHDGAAIAWAGRDRFFIDTKKHTGKAMMAYGQTAITEDLYAARDAVGGTIIDEATSVRLEDVMSDSPSVKFEKNGRTKRIDCDYIAGCDGFHGISRQSIP